MQTSKPKLFNFWIQVVHRRPFLVGAACVPFGFTTITVELISLRCRNIGCRGFDSRQARSDAPRRRPSIAASTFDGGFKVDFLGDVWTNRARWSVLSPKHRGRFPAAAIPSCDSRCSATRHLHCQRLFR
jgi:hypothetical protein